MRRKWFVNHKQKWKWSIMCATGQEALPRLVCSLVRLVIELFIANHP